MSQIDKNIDICQGEEQEQEKSGSRSGSGGKWEWSRNEAGEEQELESLSFHVVMFCARLIKTETET